MQSQFAVGHLLTMGLARHPGLSAGRVAHNGLGLGDLSSKDDHRPPGPGRFSDDRDGWAVARDPEDGVDR